MSDAPTHLENDQNCIYCHGQRTVDNATDGPIACRICLGTGRGPHPYEGDFGHDARPRELRRIAELVGQRDLALSAFELIRPWFDATAAPPDGLTDARRDAAHYTIDALFTRLENETVVHP